MQNMNVTPIRYALVKVADGDGYSWQRRWVVDYAPPKARAIPEAAPYKPAVDPKAAAIAQVRAEEKARREKEVPHRGYVTTDWKERTKYGWRGCLTGR